MTDTPYKDAALRYLEEDLAAQQRLPGVKTTIDLMDRLELLATVNIEEAVIIYFQWKVTVALFQSNPTMAANRWLQYGQKKAPVERTLAGAEQPTKEATHV